MTRHEGSPVVVGLDGSPVSTRAVDLAAHEATLRAVALRVVHVVEPIGRRPAAGARRPAISASPRRMLDWASDAVEQRHPGLMVDTAARYGLPADVLIEESQRACLTVVGHSGSGGLAGSSTGAVCAELAVCGHGPILIARGAAARHSGAPVVVGMYAGAPDEAVDFAFAEARLRGVSVLAVYACSRAAGGEHAPSDHGRAAAEQRAARPLAEAMAGWSQRYPDVKAELHVEHSLDPRAALLRASSEASLIVVGLHAQATRRRLLSNSAVATLTHHARCPVAVVHAAFA